MIKVFKENTEFGEFTRLDTDTGKLTDISEDEFLGFLPEKYTEYAGGIQKVKGNGADVFLGETPKTRTRFPRRAYIQITRNCNLLCPTCFIKAKEGDAHVPTSSLFDMASFMGENGLMEARLSGGEPTTHPDFFEILRKFREEGIYVSVATNGVMSRKKLDRLADEDNLWIICSIDGNRETHNRYRHGTFDHIVGNMKYLKTRNPDVRIRLTTVLTKENKGQMFELGEISRYIGAESINIIPLRPKVRDPEIKKQMVSAAEFKRVIEDLIYAKQKLGIEFSTTLETDYAESFRKDPIFRKKSSCAAGREGTNLDYDVHKDKLLVYGCSYSPACDLEADMNIRKPFLAGEFSPSNPEEFLKIWRNDDAWTIFRDLSLKSEDCKECEYIESNRCVGSCPIQNIDYGKIEAEKDVLIQLKDHLRQTGEWYCYKKIMR